MAGSNKKTIVKAVEEFLQDTGSLGRVDGFDQDEGAGECEE